MQGFQHVYTGKVRDLYVPTDSDFSHLVLIVASDRVSAFDNVLSPEIPGKGENLTAITNWWFDRLEINNHRSSDLAVPQEVTGRAMIAKKLRKWTALVSGTGTLIIQQGLRCSCCTFSSTSPTLLE